MRLAASAFIFLTTRKATRNIGTSTRMLTARTHDITYPITPANATMPKRSRPDILDVASSQEFMNWYWLKEEMVQFCKANSLSCAGLKFDVRDRIVRFLDASDENNDANGDGTSTVAGKTRTKKARTTAMTSTRSFARKSTCSSDGTSSDKDNKRLKTKPTSKFNWAEADLTLGTIITDNVTFGKNFRGFMTSQIGSKFVCHSDFMAWVKSQAQTATLQDAVHAWHEMDQRKVKDPTFQRVIAPQNMLASTRVISSPIIQARSSAM